mmetsp:Transcript_18166/g.25853  ORF Transcript_18166/g.25853 Transcript_18166/m.25853 type:complete len:415 (-) Transcript_18166:57-1301(-)
MSFFCLQIYLSLLTLYHNNLRFCNAFLFSGKKDLKFAYGVGRNTMTPAKSAVTKLSSSSSDKNYIGAVGSTLTDKDLAMEALALFLEKNNVTNMTPTTGGVNNIVQYVDLASGKRQLLRIYNNGFDTQKVKFEHELLKELNQMQKITGNSFSFQVPNFLPSKQGSTMARLSNGAEACMCEFIEGALPKLTCVREIGRASGELNTALAKVTAVDKSMCNVAPYWKIWDVHHAVTRENFIETLQGPDFQTSNDLLDVAKRILAETMAIVDKCQGYQSLPTQLIHGDLHYDNILVQDGKVTALLDFEFASFDWRAMELAICLSKYAGEAPDAMPYFDDFVDGFAETGLLSVEEARAIPDLINLRILSNVAYFVGRAIAGEDSISSLTTRISTYEKRVHWVKENDDIIAARIIEKMGQ